MGLNVILIPRIGLYGPPISTVAAYMTVFIIRAIDSRKLVPFRIDMKKMIVNNIVILVMMFICLLKLTLCITCLCMLSWHCFSLRSLYSTERLWRAYSTRCFLQG